MRPTMTPRWRPRSMRSAASGFVDSPATCRELYVALGSKLYNAKKFDGAATRFEHASTLNPRNTQALINLAEARFSQGRKAGRRRRCSSGRSRSRPPPGQKPEEALYKRALGIAYERRCRSRSSIARAVGRGLSVARQLAQRPRALPATWRSPMSKARSTSLRLMRATGLAANGADYSLYATAAADQLNLQRSAGVIDAGSAANKRSTRRARCSGTSSPASRPSRRRPRPTLPRRPRRRKDGMALPAHRRPLLRPWAIMPRRSSSTGRRMGKPGADASVANLHLGMALGASRRQGRRDRSVQRGVGRSCRDRQILADLRSAARLTSRGRALDRGRRRTRRRPFFLAFADCAAAMKLSRFGMVKHCLLSAE